MVLNRWLYQCVVKSKDFKQTSGGKSTICLYCLFLTTMYSVLDLNTYNFTVIGNSKEKETDNKMNKTRIPRFLKYTGK